MKHPSLIGALTAIISLGTLHAGDNKSDIIIPEPAPSEDTWQHNISPYAWLAGLEGQVGFNGLPPQDIDLPFDTIWDNLDFAGFLSVNGHKGNWGYFIDAQYLKLEATDNGPRESGDLSLEQLKLTAGILYRVWHNEQTSLSLYGTLQYFYVDTQLDLEGPMGTRKFSHSENWVDPVVGFHMRHDFNEKWFCKFLGEVGGFGVSSDLSWQAMALFGYNINECWSLAGGYRHQYVDYEDDGFVYDTDTSGPMLGLTYKF